MDDTKRLMNILALHLAKSRNIHSRELHEYIEFSTFCRQNGLSFIPLEDHKVKFLAFLATMPLGHFSFRATGGEQCHEMRE